MKRQRSVSKKDLPNNFRQKFWARSVLQGLFKRKFAHSALSGLYASPIVAKKASIANRRKYYTRRTSLYSHNVSTVIVLTYCVFSCSSLKTPTSLLYVKRQRSVSKKDLLNNFQSVLQGLLTKTLANAALRGLYASTIVAKKETSITSRRREETITLE